MSWFKRHINLTWIISHLLIYTSIPFDSPIPYILFQILFMITTLWCLHQKGRSPAWFLIPISVLFLQNQEQLAKEKEYYMSH